nr:hypothetical protein [Nonomuraea phyllanthi]
MPAQFGIAGQGLARAATPVQGAHLNLAQPFAQRVLPHQVGQLADKHAALVELQPGLGLRLQRGQPLFLQALSGRACEVLVGELGERRPSPQRQRLGQHRGAGTRVSGLSRPRGQLGEGFGVGLAGLGSEPVSRRVGGHQVIAARFGLLQRVAQAGHLQLERAGGVGGRIVAPEVVDEPLDGDRLALASEQGGQQRSHLGLRDRHRYAIRGPYLDRAQHAKAHIARLTP